MDERMRFVMQIESGEECFAAVCRRYGVSRKTGYKWFERYGRFGVGGLEDRSRAPLDHPQAVPQRQLERCLEVRRTHPSWGPVKVLAYLKRSSAGTNWPAASTIGELFDREGLRVKRRLRRKALPSSAPFAACAAANDVWCIDFKGWFLTGDGKRCEPLTLADAHSRYLLRCQAMAKTDAEHAWPVLDAAFREFGLPKALRSDNGAPFASCGAGGLSRFSVKAIKAGVLPERIEPGKPQQNGRLERLHLTLLKEAASPPAPSLSTQLKRFAAFRRLYNEQRPHAALNHATPAEHYVVSERRYDGILREPQYGPGSEVRRVRHNGEIKFAGETIYVSSALIGEPVGLSQDSDGDWNLCYGPIALGFIAKGDNRLRKPKSKTCGLVDNADALPSFSWRQR